MNELNYDAVVIGSGNGGLIAALRLAKSNKKVLLVERHILPGGFATGFSRGRFYILDTKIYMATYILYLKN